MPTLTSADGTPIAFELVGDHGPAVILVDGAMCFRGGGPMRPIARALAGGLTSVLYDRRGRGESGDVMPFAVKREIEDIGALIDTVGGRAALFGISSGGALALRAAAALGQRVSALAVYEVPFMPPGALDGAAAYTVALDSALAAGVPDDAVTAFLRRVGTPEAGIDAVRHSPAWAGMVALAPTLAYDDAAMGDSTVPVDLATGLGIPTLTLVGGASPEFLSYGVHTLADVVPGARLEVIDGQQHDVSAEAIAPHLLRFLARADARL
ncbi:alpha/beta hydrolase [Microbacterium deminutum]|uniref:Alpha/beta hydrolase n=1 Tax=Microbacterium deminutum TaxID=344164 RepID=A0ABP5CRE6_9MICO